MKAALKRKPTNAQGTLVCSLAEADREAGCGGKADNLCACYAWVSRSPRVW